MSATNSVNARRTVSSASKTVLPDSHTQQSLATVRSYGTESSRNNQAPTRKRSGKAAIAPESFLTIDEVEHFAETVAPRYRVFVLTGAYTGLHPRRTRSTAHRPARPPPPLAPGTRTDQDTRRTVSFSPFLADELTKHLDTYRGDKNLIFTAPEGGPLDLRVFRRRFRYPAFRASVGEPMRPHDLSHTHVAAGEDPYVISRQLGHASIRATYDTYGHLFEGRDRQAAEALEAARARSLADSPRTLGRSEGPSLVL